VRKATLVILALATSFGFGFAFKTVLIKETSRQSEMKKVTGSSGVFFKSKDQKKMTQWYQNTLD
jgi:hypothetical protein